MPAFRPGTTYLAVTIFENSQVRAVSTTNAPVQRSPCSARFGACSTKRMRSLLKTRRPASPLRKFALFPQKTSGTNRALQEHSSILFAFRNTNPSERDRSW
jgi:hypothetical protein